MNARRVVQAGLFAILAATAVPAQATSELHKNVTVGLVGEWHIRLNADSDFLFEILDEGPDSYQAIIDVFGYPSRALLWEGRPVTGGEILHTASVPIPSANEDRDVYVVVRPVGQAAPVVTLRGTRIDSLSSVVGSRDFPVSPSVPAAARISVPSGLGTFTQVWTTEENSSSSSGVPGTDDTILMLLHDDTPLYFDDNTGVARMSWLFLYGQPCLAGAGHSCEILVAQRTNDKSGLSQGDPGYDPPPNPDPSHRHTTVGWDEDITFGRDRDSDGLGDALEVFLGTCPDPDVRTIDSDRDGIPDCDDPDVDGDGIRDGIEVLGVRDALDDQDTKVSLGRFPFYGADPLHQDLFIEADCIPGCAGGPPQCPDATKKNKCFTLQDVMRLASAFPPEVAVHFDYIDSQGANPNGGTVGGDWGGSEVLADGVDARTDYCVGFSPLRGGLFTHVILGEGPQNAHRCTRLEQGPGSLSGNLHELGHYMGLDHWGDREGTSGKVNCKPHYLSAMNYNYAWSAGDFLQHSLPVFSRGLFKDVALNPMALDETAGLRVNPPNQDVLRFLDDVPRLHPTKVGGVYTGGVDWNGNGEVEPETVQGMINFPIDVGGDCDPSPPLSRLNWNFAHGVAFPTLSVENGTLHMSGIVPLGWPLSGFSPAVLVGAHPGDLSQCHTKSLDPLNPTDCARWGPPPEYSGSLVLLPLAKPGPYAPAVAGGIVVYADEDGNLFFFPEPSSSGAISATPVGGPPINGDPVAVQRPSSGLVTVYAPSQGVLRRWDYDPRLKLWVQLGAVEYWASVGGAPEQPVAVQAAGIGLAWGYQLGLPGDTAQFPGANLYAAILTPSVLGQSPVVLARLDATEIPLELHGPLEGSTIFLLLSSWIPLSGFHDAAKIPVIEDAPGDVVVPGRIGLAFRPDDPAALEPRPGRFYVSLQRRSVNDSLGPVCSGGTVYENVPYFTVSRGNRYSDTQNMDVARGLVFDRLGHVANEWSSYAGGASLAYFDGHVRGVQQTNPLFARLCADPPVVYDPLIQPMTSFYALFDGIFNVDEYDHDDVSYIQNHLAWALGQ